MLSYFTSRRQQVMLSKTLKVGENYYLGIILTIDMIRIFIYKSAIKLLLPYQLISCTAQVVKPLSLSAQLAIGESSAVLTGNLPMAVRFCKFCRQIESGIPIVLQLLTVPV